MFAEMSVFRKHIIWQRIAELAARLAQKPMQ